MHEKELFDLPYLQNRFPGLWLVNLTLQYEYRNA